MHIQEEELCGVALGMAGVPQQFVATATDKMI